MRERFVRAWGRVVVMACMVAACRENGEGPLPPASAESLLFGGEPCGPPGSGGDSVASWLDSDCASGRCVAGMCVGFLMTSVEAMRMAMLPRLGRAAADEDARRMMVETLTRIVADPQTDPFLRARATQVSVVLPAREAVPILEPRLEDGEEAVRFQAARALHRLGDPRGTQVMQSFLEHPSAPVRALARFVLEREVAHGVNKR